MNNMKTSILILTFLFPLSAFAGNAKPSGGFGEAITTFSTSVEKYISLATAAEAGVFRIISETTPKDAARREVLLAVFVRYLNEEQRSLSALRKDVEGILNLAESEMPGPAAAKAEMNRVQEYLASLQLIKWGKVKALETALIMPAAKFEDISKLGNLLYAVNPTQDAAADAYAGVMASRDTLANSLKELERSVLLAELAAANSALREPQTGAGANSNTARKPARQRAVVGESILKTGGDQP